MPHLLHLSPLLCFLFAWRLVECCAKRHRQLHYVWSEQHDLLLGWSEITSVRQCKQKLKTGAAEPKDDYLFFCTCIGRQYILNDALKSLSVRASVLDDLFALQDGLLCCDGLGNFVLERDDLVGG